MKEHERIWLQPAVDADPYEGRQWCQDKIWDDGIEYVRADLALSASPAGVGVETQPWNNDTIWARFYRDGKTLGEICEEFECGIYDLSPWLTAPLVRAALKGDEQ